MARILQFNWNGWDGNKAIFVQIRMPMNCQPAYFVISLLDDFTITLISVELHGKMENWHHL